MEKKRLYTRLGGDKREEKKKRNILPWIGRQKKKKSHYITGFCI